MSGLSFFGHSVSAFFLFISLAFLSTPAQAMENEEMKVDAQKTKHAPVKEKSVTYTIDENDNTVRFFYNDSKPDEPLDPAQLFYSHMFPKGVLFFNGKIDREKFTKAMASTLQQFPILFGRFHNDKGLSIKHDSAYFIQLERGQCEEKITTSQLNFLLPEKIDKKISSGIIDSLDGLPNLEALPLVVLKLTHLKDGFAIGYYVNHIFDQSSIVYFFKYLSLIYTLGKNNGSLKPPVALNLQPWKSNLSTFDTLEKVQSEGQKLGFRYVPDKKALGRLYTTRQAYSTINLQFNMEKIRDFKKQDRSLSENDIIHAILFKIYAMDPNLPRKELSFAFACNMRKRLDQRDEVIGNVLISGHIPLNVDIIKNDSILELAQLSRKYVQQLGVKQFEERLNWYANLELFKQNPQNYMADSFVDLAAPRVSNWSSFDYSNINFDGCLPIALKTQSYAPFGINIICFDNTNEKETLTTSVKIPSTCLPAIKELQEKIDLFTSSSQE